MGLLDTTAGNPLDKLAGLLTNPFGNPNPTYKGPDFPRGLEITEFIEGVESKDTQIILVGNAMPKNSLNFGGEQKIVTEYYAGYSEPVVQVLGPRESETQIIGTFKANKFKPGAFAAVPVQLQESVDAMRKRGNLVRLVLGDWVRFGYIQKANFKLYKLTRIDYEISFLIIGDKLPTNCKFVQNSKQNPTAINQDLINAAAAFEASRDKIHAPSKSITDILNGLISSVASVINGVTGFVGSLLALASDITSSLNRALGLIKNARATISVFKRQFGLLKLNIAAVAAGYKAAKKITFSNLYAHSTMTTVSLATTMQLLLAKLQKQFEKIARTTPIARFRVRAGDTLQNVAQRFYSNSNLWKNIYDHNKLSTPELVVGSVLEIPHL